MISIYKKNKHYFFKIREIKGVIEIFNISTREKEIIKNMGNTSFYKDIYDFISKYPISNKTKMILQEAHSDLRILFLVSSKYYNFSGLQGYRGEQEQEKAFKKRFSKAHFLQSPHNFIPSLAVDVTPYPIRWNLEEMSYFAGLVKGISLFLEEQRIIKKVNWGGNWGKERISKSFPDRPHFQVSNWRGQKDLSEKENEENFLEALIKLFNQRS